MKTLVYETKVDSRAALRHRIFAAAEHISTHPDNIASATHSLLKRAEKCIELEEDTLNNSCKAGIAFKYRQVVGLYQNPQSIMLNEYFNTAGYSCVI